jgi:hypothetical protein
MQECVLELFDSRPCSVALTLKAIMKLRVQQKQGIFQQVARLFTSVE